MAFRLPPLAPPDWSYGDYVRRAAGLFITRPLPRDRGTSYGNNPDRPRAATPGINPVIVSPTSPGQLPPSSGGDLLNEILRKNPTFNPKGPPPRIDPTFEELLNRKKPSEFDELLKRKPYNAKVGSLAWALARTGGLLASGLLYSRDAGRGSDRRDEPLPKKKAARKEPPKGPPKRPRIGRPIAPPELRPPVARAPASPRTAPQLPAPREAQPGRDTPRPPNPLPVARPMPQPAVRARPQTAPAPERR